MKFFEPPMTQHSFRLKVGQVTDVYRAPQLRCPQGAVLRASDLPCRLNKTLGP